MPRLKIPAILKNKYLIALTVFLVWIVIFDSNNLIDRFRSLRELKQLRSDEEYYQQKIEDDSRKLRELKTDRESLEKFAREQYYMKKDNEDIFIVIDEEEEK